MPNQTLRPLALKALAALALLLSALSAHAQTVINSLPYTISTPGDYVLGGNLTYNGNGAAITFAVGNVTLDFNGHFISNLGAGVGNSGYGLYGSNRANITVQNGSIVGFYVGIYFDGTADNAGNNTGNVVTNMRLPSNTTYGVILTYPTTCRVENCQINKIGSSAGASSAYGIYVTGGSMTLKNNQISTVTASTAANAYGIYCFAGNAHFVIGNQIDNCNTALRMNTASGNKYQNNLTGNVVTAFVGGQDAGNNN